MAFDSTAFLNDITNGVALDEQTKAALQSALNNPAIAKKLEESTLRQSDYSKKMADTQAYWNKLNDWENTRKAELDREKAALRTKLANGEVSLDDLGTPDAPSGRGGITEDQLKKLAQESLAYMNTVTKLSAQHSKEFGEVLDLDKLVEQATKEGTNIVIAYDRFIQPKRDEIQKAEVQKQLAAAREEGRQEAIKNVTVPVNSEPFSNSIPSSIDALNKKAEDKTGYGSMAAIQAWKQNRTKLNPLF